MAWIRAEGVWKRFLLRKDRADSVGQLLMQMIPGRSRPKPEPFWALQNVSFEMPDGESLGIMGRNGSGKSTLLKLLTRTMRPTLGKIDSSGKISALIELGVGFHPDFTGRENVVLSASILGIRRREIERRMDDVIDFAGIRPFIDTPVKYYSSGMHARLGFAVAIHVEPEILVVDEVLAVGDEPFQQKCLDRILQMKQDGVGILLVSHDLGAIDRLMDRAIWIEEGVIRANGNPRDVVRAYRASHAVSPGHDTHPRLAGHDLMPGDSPVQLVDAYVVSGGKRTAIVSSGKSVDFVLELDSQMPTPLRGALTLSLRRPDGLQVAEVSSARDGVPLEFPPGRCRVIVSTPELRLVAGAYEVDATFVSDDGRRLAEWRPALRFHVHSQSGEAGIIMVPHRWHFESLHEQAMIPALEK